MAFWFPGKLVSEIVGTLKEQPLLLALVLLNATLLVLVYLSTMDLREKYHQQVLQLIAACVAGRQ